MYKFDIVEWNFNWIAEKKNGQDRQIYQDGHDRTIFCGFNNNSSNHQLI